MKKLAYLLLSAFLLAGCCHCKSVVKETTTIEKDSDNVEVRKEIVYVPDTVMVEIPAQKAERITGDSVSHLENDYAISDVRVGSDGSLHHTLETKPQKRPVEFQKPVERNDSVVYKYKYKYLDREVVKQKEMSRWDRFKLDYGGWSLLACGLLAGFVIWRIARRFA